MPLGVNIKWVKSDTGSNPLCSHNRELTNEGVWRGPFILQANKQEISTWKSPGTTLPSLMPRHQPSGERQHCPSGMAGQGRGWGCAGGGSAKGISELLELMLCASRLLIQAMPQTCTPPNELCSQPWEKSFSCSRLTHM